MNVRRGLVTRRLASRVVVSVGLTPESVRARRVLIIMASGSGTTVPAIARLVAAHQDTVRDVIHAFNERGLAALDLLIRLAAE